MLHCENLQSALQHRWTAAGPTYHSRPALDFRQVPRLGSFYVHQKIFRSLSECHKWVQPPNATKGAERVMHRFSRRASKAAQEFIIDSTGESSHQGSQLAVEQAPGNEPQPPQLRSPGRQTKALEEPEPEGTAASKSLQRRSPRHLSPPRATPCTRVQQGIQPRCTPVAGDQPLQPSPALKHSSQEKAAPVNSPSNRSSGKRAAASQADLMQQTSQPQSQKRRQPDMDEVAAASERDPPQTRPTAQTSGGRDSTAATTVMEAQELGEQARFRDDTLWALDGLMPGAAPGTQRESLAALLEICANRRGRLALRSTGLAENVLAATAKLEFSSDAALALAAAAVLMAFCQADADPRLLGRSDVAELARKLLHFPGAMPPGSSLSNRILRQMQEPPYPRLLPREASVSPQSVTLAALSGVLDPHNSNVNIDPLKHALRNAGLLEAAAQLAVDHGPALNDAAPTMQTVQALWRVHRALLVLENCCFACSENEAHLVNIEVTLGLPPLVARMGIAQWLVQQVKDLGRQGLVLGLKKDCLRVLLAVLMNMTQNNAAGRNKVVAARALEAVPLLLAKILQSGSIAGASVTSEELSVWVDELSSCLGLLINLVEHDRDLRGRLRSIRLPGGAGVDTLGIVTLLSRLVAVAASQPSSDGASQKSPGGVGRRRSLGGDEVTLDSLEHGQGEGAASIVEVYAAILLGFLIEGHREAQAAAAALLPGKTIESVVGAVARCLVFYVSAGAITKSTEDSLRALLASLNEQSARMLLPAQE